MIRFGYKASAEQFAPAELLRFAILAEEVGFDSVFVSDHIQPWRHDGGHAPAALPWLGALGARTERLVIGTIHTAEELCWEYLCVHRLAPKPPIQIT